MKTHITNRFLLPSLLAGLGLLLTGRVTAQTFTTLHSFTNSDRRYPRAGLILSGNTLYGTAAHSGMSGAGTVFAINTDGTGFTNLHSFAAVNNQTNSDGAYPQAGLIISGNTLYGTASWGGNSGAGTVFSINTDGTGFTNLYNFAGGVDGGYPQAGLILSGNTLYGTASGGSSGYDLGTVFAINTNGTGFTDLFTWDFPSGASPSPLAGLVASGNLLFGTTSGGTVSGGTVFAVTVNSAGAAVGFTTLYSFTRGLDGAYPGAGLIISGNTLYGTASEGGAYGDGTVFRLSLDSVFAPIVHDQPQDLVVPAGAGATFSVVAGDATPLAYQWKYDGTNVPGATNTALTLTNVSLSNSGAYLSVLVTNLFGATLSSNALLTVLPMLVSTQPASGISTNGVAMLNGSATLGPPETLAWFEWGSDTNYGAIVGVTNLAGRQGNVALSTALSGLSLGESYHYRLVAWNNWGIVYGNDQSFAVGLIPSVATLPATGITTGGATLNAIINPNGPDTAVFFVWGATTSYGHATPATDLGKGSSAVNVDSRLSGLAPGSIYHFQVVASNALGQASGPDASFLTGPWMETSAPAGAGVVASSADGTRLISADGVAIYTSADSGMTWRSNSAPIANWTAVASSADGVRLVAVAGNEGHIFTSTNAGSSWASNAAPHQYWNAVASSADGVRLVAVSGYGVFTSTNAGWSWTSNAAPIQGWTSVASSADGTKLLAAAYQGGIGASTNAGASWTLTSAPADLWSSVASSADGSKWVAASGLYAGGIYVSWNYGATWTLTSAPLQYWSSVASSADGTRLAAAAFWWNGGLIFTSTNSGRTWRQGDAPPAGWNSIASSADGHKLAAAAGQPNPGIYTLQTTSTPSLSLTRSGSNALLSWTIPSLEFTLQQNSDLTTTNWTDVPTPPVLNLTNLQNQVIVSPTNGHTFYRLKH